VSESDSFIHEVSEEVRRDQFFAFLRRRGWMIGAVILIVVGGAAANEWRKARDAAAAEAAGDAMRAAFQEQDAALRAEQLAAIADGTPRAAPLARLAEAASLAEAGAPEDAARVLAALAEDGDTDAVYRALAALQRIMLLGPDLEASERLATLQGLTRDGAPFRPLALEQRALAHLEMGDDAAAIADLEEVLAAPNASEALAARARQLIIAAGGALPLAGMPAGLPAPADG
jgi:hypothetical protein